MSDYDDLPLFSLDLDESVEPEIAVRPELLTIKLFKQAIQEAKGNQEDVLLQRFAEYSHSWSSEVRCWIDDAEFNLETI